MSKQKKIPCVDSWPKTLSTLNSFLIPTDLTAIFSCSTVTGDLAFKLFVWTSGRTRQKTLILPECCPISEAQIVGNSSSNNCYLELKTVPFRSMSLSSASRLLLSRCRCLDRRVEISSATNMGIEIVPSGTDAKSPSLKQAINNRWNLLFQPCRAEVSLL